jgi:hypothetical protein
LALLEQEVHPVRMVELVLLAMLVREVIQESKALPDHRDLSDPQELQVHLEIKV